MSNHHKSPELACLLLICCLSISLFSQSRHTLNDLYRSGQVETLGQYLQNDQIRYTDWQLFVTAIFETDGELAIKTMMAAYLQSNDEELQGWIRERVSNYYAAGGSYGAASRILRDESYFHTLLNDWVRTTETRFGIQIGAYQTYENALAKKQEMQGAFSDIQILEKSRTNKILYTVVIGGFDSREAAEGSARDLRSASTIGDFMIIQY